MERKEQESNPLLPAIKINFVTTKSVDELRSAAISAMQRYEPTHLWPEKVKEFLTKRLTEILALIDKLYAGKWSSVRNLEALEQVSDIYIKSRIIQRSQNHSSQPQIVSTLSGNLSSLGVSSELTGTICADAISFVATGKAKIENKPTEKDPLKIGGVMHQLRKSRLAGNKLLDDGGPQGIWVPKRHF